MFLSTIQSDSNVNFFFCLFFVRFFSWCFRVVFHLLVPFTWNIIWVQKKLFTLTFLGWLCANLMSRNDAYPTKPLLSWRMSNGVTRFAIAVAVLPLLLHLFMILLLNNPITLSQSYQQLNKYNRTIVPSQCTNVVPIANTHKYAHTHTVRASV